MLSNPGKALSHLDFTVGLHLNHTRAKQPRGCQRCYSAKEIGCIGRLEIITYSVLRREKRHDKAYEMNVLFAFGLH